MLQVTPRIVAITVVVALAAVVLTPAAGQAQAQNHPSSTLLVNFNAEGVFPLDVLMGELEPNVIRIEGTPNAAYTLMSGTFQTGSEIPGLGWLHIDRSLPFKNRTGVLDASGAAQIMLDPNRLTAGSALTFQAAVADPSMGSGFRLSGATRGSVVFRLSSPPELAMQPGSVADILGPITAIGAEWLAVGNIVYDVTPNTVFENFVDLSELDIGQWMAVEGDFNASGGMDAIVLVTEDASPEVRITGRIQGVGPSGFSVLNVSVYSTTGTDYLDLLTGLPGQYSDLVAGMPVKIYVPAETQYPYITKMELNVEIEFEPEPEPEPEPEDEDPPPPPFCS